MSETSAAAVQVTLGYSAPQAEDAARRVGTQLHRVGLCADLVDRQGEDAIELGGGAEVFATIVLLGVLRPLAKAGATVALNQLEKEYLEHVGTNPPLWVELVPGPGLFGKAERLDPVTEAKVRVFFEFLRQVLSAM